jgi:predicted transcriptional regulator
MPDTDPTSDVSALTVQLLSAYLANNTVPSGELAELIRSTKAALTEDGAPEGELAEPESFTPAVSARKSLASPEHIISLIDGKPYKTLKRHLASRGLTPNDYRSRYNLPPTYPMVAPAYAEHRRAVAQRLGLGRKGPKPEAVEEQASAASEPDVQATPAPVQEANPPAKGSTRGRKKAAPAKADTATDAIADIASAAPDVATGADAAPEGGAGAPRKAGRPPVEKSRAGRTRKARGPDAGQASGAADAAGSEPAAAQPAEAKTAKRRGKIGLFKKGGAEDGSANDES